MATRLRLVHPFPSALNAVAVGAIALVAGASAQTAGRLAISMLTLQFAIGTINDVADAHRDAGRLPPKPIPAGLVSRRAAVVVGAACAVVGLLLAAAGSGGGSAVPWTVVIAAVGLGCGLAYDLGLSRTAASWLPLAIALPLVPTFAWYGATGSLPARLVPVLPLGMLAGAGLAVGNALVDLAGDAAHGRRTIAVAVGPVVAWRLCAAALGLAAILAVVDHPPDGLATGLLAVAGLGALAAGVLLARPGSGRERVARAAWALESIGIAALGVGWVIGGSP